MLNKISVLVFITFNLPNLLFNQVKILKFHENRIQTFRSEFIIYKSLLKNPLKKNTNFLFVPWNSVVEHEQMRKNNLENNTLINNLKNKVKLKRGFTICEHDFYESLIPYLVEMGINVLFTPAANKNKHKGMDIVSIPYFTRNNVLPALQKDIWYSFVGANTHEIRQKIFEMEHPNNTIIIKREKFHYNQEPHISKQYEQEYSNILSRSRFSLCPRGKAAGSYRFWESLQAGAIPILISDNYLLPPGFNWEKCIIKINESEIDKIPELLQNISPTLEEKMRKVCLHAYSLYSGENYDRVIRLYYNDNVDDNINFY